MPPELFIFLVWVASAAAAFVVGRRFSRKASPSPPQVVVMAHVTTRATGGTMSVGHEGADVVIRMTTAQKDASAEVRLGTDAAVRLSALLIAYSNTMSPVSATNVTSGEGKLMSQENSVHLADVEPGTLLIDSDCHLWKREVAGARFISGNDDPVWWDEKDFMEAEEHFGPFAIWE